MPDVYMVHSMVRRGSTRLKRAKSPGRHRFVQRIAGGAITVRRARPAPISEAVLLEHLEELHRREECGMLEVRTQAGLKVDLTTLEVAAPPNPPPPMGGLVEGIFDIPGGIEPSPAELAERTIEPDEISMTISEGAAPLTHPEDRDPAKKRRSRRKK